jgi:hypothetical protein
LQLDIILRGQSNAAYLAELDGGAAARTLVQEVQQLLGFDGVSDRVRLIYDRDGKGGDTVYPGTAFLGEWMVPNGSGGWQPGQYEQAFLDRMGQYRAEGMGNATAVVWLHSEYDSRDPNLSTSDWVSAVRTDAALVRETLGRDVPYLFVAAHPYGDGTDTGHQAIRAGMERLSTDPGFKAAIAARAPDIDASLDNLDGNPNTAEYGAAHINPYDARLIAARVARSVAEEFAAYAKPGSAVASAGGNIASDGPQVVAATPLGGNAVQVDVVHDGTSGFLALSEGAASGLGWSARLSDGRRIEASSAAILDADSLVVTFGQAVPVGTVLDYAWGIGRTAEPGGPGLGNAVMDPTYLPVWTPAVGVVIGGGPQAAPAAIVEPVTPAPGAQVALDPELVIATGLARLGYGRAGTEAEVTSLQAMLEGGTTAPELALALAEAPGFQARNGGLDDEAFITQLHQDSLGRDPTEAEIDEWRGYFDSGTPREVLAEGLAMWWEFAVIAEARAPADVTWV